MRALLAAAVTAALVPLGACSLFPKHEEVWTPIPTRLGQARPVEGDTAWVLSEPAYELVTLDRERLPDVKTELDLAVRTYRRVVGGEPRPVAVALADSAAQLGRLDTTAYRRRGLQVVPVVAPQPRRRSDEPMSSSLRAGLAGARVVPAAARAWVRARGGEGVRLPEWLLEGATVLVAEPLLADVGPLLLDRERSHVLPLAELFTARVTPPELAPGERRPVRRGLRADSLVVRRAESALALRFLMERGGAPVVARLLDAARDAGNASSPAALLAAAGVSPASPDSLEAPWRRWLAEQREARGARRGM
jgi:hypothetical protein